MDQQRTYPAGVTSWIDLEVDDLAGAQDFYTGLFGWSWEVTGPPGAPPAYLIARLDGSDVAGLGTGAGDEPAGAWSTYVAVDDADAAAAAVTRAGGTVLGGPQPAGEAGRLVLCADPAGVPFRLWQAGRRPGAQAVNEPGSWVFSDLRTHDVAAATAFYGQVFGWDVDDLGDSLLVRRPGYGAHLAATVNPGILELQGAVGVPPGFEDAVAWFGPVGEHDAGPHWHVAIAVADRDAAAARAAELGATVVATTETGWTRDAMVRDPFGAVLTLSQFTPPEE